VMQNIVAPLALRMKKGLEGWGGKGARRSSKQLKTRAAKASGEGSALFKSRLAAFYALKSMLVVPKRQA